MTDTKKTKEEDVEYEVVNGIESPDLDERLEPGDKVLASELPKGQEDFLRECGAIRPFDGEPATLPIDLEDKADDLIPEIGKATNPEQLAELDELERAGKNRKTVLAAIGDRLDAVTEEGAGGETPDEGKED